MATVNAQDILRQAKYCSICGKTFDSCECQDQGITVTININKELMRGLSTLTALIPKIQISSTRCPKCGHSPDKCTCS